MPNLKKERLARLKKRKNFLPTLILTTSIWGAWLIIFFYVPPEGLLTPILFLTTTSLAALFTGALLFTNTRRGALAALGVLTFMLLNYFKIGNFLNIILLLGILLALDYYLSKR